LSRRPKDELSRLRERSRDLLEELETTRQDLLSVADVNRLLRQVLRNQIALMNAHAESAPLGVTGAQRRSAKPQTEAPRISLRERRPDELATEAAEGVEDVEDAEDAEDKRAWEPLPAADERDDPKQRDYRRVERIESMELTEILDELDDDLEALPAKNGKSALKRRKKSESAEAVEAANTAATVLNEDRDLPQPLARVFVEQFDNRDKDYSKGLEKLNRWVGGDGAGTPFQWRGDRAYLNVRGAGPKGVRNYEKQIMKRMGFARRLGRLCVPGLDGEIVVYERP